MIVMVLLMCQHLQDLQVITLPSRWSRETSSGSINPCRLRGYANTATEVNSRSDRTGCLLGAAVFFFGGDMFWRFFLTCQVRVVRFFASSFSSSFSSCPCWTRVVPSGPQPQAFDKERRPERMPEDMPKRLPERMSDDMPCRMPEKMSEDMRDRNTSGS